MKHTPGPWRWKWLGSASRLLGPNEEWIHSDGSAGGEYSPDIDVDGPNARLIAASPDLLEALERMLVSFSGDLCIECGEVSGKGKGCDSCYVLGEAEAAIRKAKEGK